MVGDVDHEARERRVRGGARADERMRAKEHDVIVAEGVTECAEVEVGRVPGDGDPLAAERRRVQDHPAAVWDRVPPANLGSDQRLPLVVEEEVRAGDSEAGREPLPRSSECLRVERREAVGRDEAQIVVGVHGDRAGVLLVRPEPRVEHAVAELLERPAGVPDLDEGGTPPRPDDVHREEVVVDDEEPGGREVEARPQGMDRRSRQLAPTTARPECELDHVDIRARRSDAVANPRQVPGDSRPVSGREHDPWPDGQEPAGEEAEADERRAQRDQWAHGWCMSGAR